MYFSQGGIKMYQTYQTQEVEKKKDDESKLANFAPSDDFHLTLKMSTTSGCFLCSFDKKFPMSNIEVKDKSRIHGESMSRVPLHVLQDMHCYTMLYM